MFEFLNIRKSETRILNWMQYWIWNKMCLIKYSRWCPKSSSSVGTRIRIEIKYVPIYKGFFQNSTVILKRGHKNQIFEKLCQQTLGNRGHRIQLGMFPNDSIEANDEPCISQSYTAKPYGAWDTFSWMFLSYKIKTRRMSYGRKGFDPGYNPKTIGP